MKSGAPHQPERLDDRQVVKNWIVSARLLAGFAAMVAFLKVVPGAWDFVGHPTFFAAFAICVGAALALFRRKAARDAEVYWRRLGTRPMSLEAAEALNLIGGVAFVSFGLVTLLIQSLGS